jgi:glutamate formiminotransferase/formiminotetrahydrofolate cyclodeaminase
MVDKIVECVPNFSEGNDLEKIRAITDAAEAVDDVTLLDVDPGADTNRTVVTIVGSPEAVKESAFQAIAKAAEVIDMRTHEGTHARMGATDVCPFVPISGVTMDDCVQYAREVGERVASELHIPVYLYEHAAATLERQNLAIVRAGEYEGLEEKLKDPNWKPDFGAPEFNAQSGATIMGAREFLIAYNINLNTKDGRWATDIAFELREKGRSKRNPNPISKNLLDGEIVRDEKGKAVKVLGMFKDVKAVGWYVDTYSRAQISINFTNYKVSSIHEVYDAACRLAEERGLRVTGSELVGLIPLEALLMAGRHYLQKQGRTSGVPVSELVEIAVQSLGLNDVAPFVAQEKIIEYAVRNDKGGLISMTVKDFVEELSTDSPAPGGGSVSALLGSLAAALASMVAALTHGKKGMEEKKSQMENVGIKAQELKDRLSTLVDADTEAFNELMAAMRLPKKTDEQKTARHTAVQEATKAATKIPLEIAKLCSEVLDLADVVAREGLAASVSDAGVAAEAALAGLRGARLNVLINLADIEDEKFKKGVSDEVNDMERSAAELKRKVITQVENVIAGA